MQLLNEFKELAGWDAHYSWLVRQGSGLSAPFDKTKAIRIPNCTSGVWYYVSNINGHLILEIHAEAMLVKGLMKLIMDTLHNIPVPLIPQKLEELKSLKLNDYLSYSRRNGLNVLLSHINAYYESYMKNSNNLK